MTALVGVNRPRSLTPGPEVPRFAPMRPGQILKRLRFERGLTQRDLARASGVGTSTIRDLELGHRDVILATTAYKLAAVFDVAPTIFLNDEEGAA